MIVMMMMDDDDDSHDDDDDDDDDIAVMDYVSVYIYTLAHELRST